MCPSVREFLSITRPRFCVRSPSGEALDLVNCKVDTGTQIYGFCWLKKAMENGVQKVANIDFGRMGELILKNALGM